MNHRKIYYKEMAEGQGLNDKDKGRDDPKGITLSEVVGWATTGIAMVSRTPQVKAHGDRRKGRTTNVGMMLM